jgi:hypothetical protein
LDNERAVSPAEPKDALTRGPVVGVHMVPEDVGFPVTVEIADVRVIARDAQVRSRDGLEGAVPVTERQAQFSLSL